jgi:hypothetical protein
MTTDQSDEMTLDRDHGKTRKAVKTARAEQRAETDRRNTWAGAANAAYHGGKLGHPVAPDHLKPGLIAVRH